MERLMTAQDLLEFLQNLQDNGKILDDIYLRPIANGVPHEVGAVAELVDADDGETPLLDLESMANFR